MFTCNFQKVKLVYMRVNWYLELFLLRFRISFQTLWEQKQIPCCCPLTHLSMPLPPQVQQWHQLDALPHRDSHCAAGGSSQSISTNRSQSSDRDHRGSGVLLQHRDHRAGWFQFPLWTLCYRFEVQFMLYSPKSHITTSPQRAVQSVHRHPWPLTSR